MSNIAGSKAILDATFRDKDNVLFDPSNITIRIIHPNESTVLETITTNITRVSTGIYEYTYTLPYNYSHIFHEWSGKDDANVTDLARQQIDIVYSD
jgi:hypothetical protein